MESEHVSVVETGVKQVIGSGILLSSRKRSYCQVIPCYKSMHSEAGDVSFGR